MGYGILGTKQVPKTAESMTKVCETWFNVHRYAHQRQLNPKIYSLLVSTE